MAPAADNGHSTPKNANTIDTGGLFDNVDKAEKQTTQEKRNAPGGRLRVLADRSRFKHCLARTKVHLL
jgi:hypothetical protein